MSTREKLFFPGCVRTSNLASMLLLGEAGSGKTTMAQQLQKINIADVITLSLVVSLAR